RKSCAITSAIRRIRQRRFVHAETQLAVRTATEDKGFVHHYFVTGYIDEIDISHGDSELAMNLDAVLGRIVVVPNLNPMLQRKTGILGEIGVAGHEVG